MDWIVAGIIVLIGAGLALSAIWLYGGLCARGIRIQSGDCGECWTGTRARSIRYSPISLASLIVTGLLLLPLLQRINVLPKPLRTIIYCFFGRDWIRLYDWIRPREVRRYLFAGGVFGANRRIWLYFDSGGQSEYEGPLAAHRGVVCDGGERLRTGTNI